MAKSKFEVRAQKELENQGWLVDWKIRPSGFKNPKGYNIDYFGLFDLLAYRAGDPLRFISVKPASNCPVKHQQDITNFFLPESCQKEIWRYDRDPKDRRRLRVRKKIY